MGHTQAAQGKPFLVACALAGHCGDPSRICTNPSTHLKPGLAHTLCHIISLPHKAGQLTCPHDRPSCLLNARPLLRMVGLVVLGQCSGWERKRINTHTYTRTHARMHSLTHAGTQAHKHTQEQTRTSKHRRSERGRELLTEHRRKSWGEKRGEA